MNIKKIVRYLELKSQLTAEELQMAETMVGLTESDKEALAGLLQPVKVSKPVTKRVIEKCEACNYTRRAIHHTLTTHADYHEFQPPQSSSKSKRASGIAATLGSRSRKPPQPTMCVACGEDINHSNHDLANGGHEFTTDLAGRVNEVLDGHNDGDTCTFEGCTRPADDNVHHLATHSYYHEFQPASEPAQAASGG